MEICHGRANGVLKGGSNRYSIEHFRRTSEAISKEQKKTFRETYDRQFKHIADADAVLEGNWHDLGTWQKLNAAQASLETIRLNKLEQRQNVLAAHWCTVGDRCSREFFEFHTTTSCQSLINELVEDGRVHRTPQAIENYIHRYYMALYSNDRQVDDNAEARAECLSGLCAIKSHASNERSTDGGFRE